MPTLADLPLPSANEYPYNLSGDQAKARALSAAALKGDAGALARLRSIGLDKDGGLLRDNKSPSTGGHTEQDRYDNARESAARAQEFSELMQTSRLDLDKRRVDLEEKRYEDALAMQATGGGGGGGGKGGGRGGGKGGGKSAISQAYDDARKQRIADRQSRQRQAQDDNAYRESEAKSRGFDNAAEMDRSDHFNRGSGKNSAGAGGVVSGGEYITGATQYAPNDAPIDPATGKPTMGYDRDGNPVNADGSKIPKVTHKHGNKYAGMTRARGDLA